MSAESPTPNREIAYRLFAAEYDDSTLSHAESDEERAPNYVITPTGARINRLFVVGTLTEVSSVNDEMLRARVVDPTGAFVVYAGQYQPDELAALEQLEPPAFVAVTGKARTFQPDDSDQVYTSIRPESIATVDAETRDRWVVSAAEQTADRIGAYATAAGLDSHGSDLHDALVEAGVDEPLARGIPLAQDHYGTTPTYLEALRELSLETAEVIAGDRETVDEFGVRPNETNPESQSFEEIANAAGVDIDLSEIPTTATDSETEQAEQSLDGDTTPDTTESPDSSGETGTDELLGSAEASEPAETDPSSEGETDPSSGGESVLPSEVSADADGESAEAADTIDAGDEVDATLDTGSDVDTAVETSDGTDAPAESDPGDSIESDEERDTAVDDAASATEEAGGQTEPDLESDSGSEDEDLGDFDSDGMYEMDDEEREELEAEFGTEFSTGAEVDEAGSADIDVPDGDEQMEMSSAEDLGESETDETPAEESSSPADAAEERGDGAETETEPDTDAEPESVDEPDEEINVQAQVIETMNRLDDGGGADRSAVVSGVVEETGVDSDRVEDAIQDALMGGQCYEPDDETLKAI